MFVDKLKSVFHSFYIFIDEFFIHKFEDTLNATIDNCFIDYIALINCLHIWNELCWNLSYFNDKHCIYLECSIVDTAKFIFGIMLTVFVIT